MKTQSSLCAAIALGFTASVLAIAGAVNHKSTAEVQTAYRASGRFEMAQRASGRFEMANRGSGRFELMANRGSGRFELMANRGSGRFEFAYRAAGRFGSRLV